MKPRTKLQVRVFSLSKQLPPLYKDQKEWAYKHCLEHVGYRTKTKTSCLDCGNVWPGDQKLKTCVCPKCNTKLTIKDTLKRNLDQTKIVFAVVDAVEEFQVIRYFEVYSYHKAGFEPEQHTREIVEQWFVPGGKLTIVGRTQSYSNDGYTGDMEIRANLGNYYTSNKYNLWAYKIHPDAKCLPIYKRNGFTSKVNGLYPYDMFSRLLNDSKVETLLKTKQFNLLSARLGNRDSDVSRYWDSIKICIRNKFIVKDAITWLDYLNLLSYFRKDLRSEKYVCVKNLKQEHDRLVVKKNEVERRLKSERQREKIAKSQQAYFEAKNAFFGIVFTMGNLTVKVLEDVKEFMDEGDIHKHCVFASEYYKKQDSLIFSAQVNGKPVETVELSLSKLKVVQSRGFRNEASEYNKQIIDLLTKNMHVIKNRCSLTPTP